MLTKKFPVLYLLLLISFFLFTAQKRPGPKKTKLQIPERPHLVVGIIVEQMRYDYIYRYWDKFGKDGFKRLINDGFHCKNTNYNFSPSYTAAAHAAIFTGTTPSVNGIIGNEWYDRQQDSMINCVMDKGFATIGSFNTAGERSSRKLLTTTIADELRRTSNMQSRCIGISSKDKNAIFPVGHTGNGAYWLDATSGKWITSSFYMQDLPDWVKGFNARKLALAYLSQPWKTLLPISNYTESTHDDMPYEKPFNGAQKAIFPYDLSKLKDTDKELIQKTPFSNSLTTDFAIEVIKNEKLGKGNFSDLLSVSFSATDCIGQQFGPNSVEMEDTYLRLDRDIAELLKFLDSYLWKGNVLVFLTSDNCAATNTSYMDSLRVPIVHFNERKVWNELENHLEKTFGKDKGKQKASWVLSVRNQQVFLNYALAAKKKINVTDLQRQAVNFLENTAGVAKAFYADELKNTEFTQLPGNAVQKGFYPKRSGDIILVLTPGSQDLNMKNGATPSSGFSYDSHVPLIWYGWKIQKGESNQTVSITDIAPTIADFLNVSRPNGCTGQPISGLIK